VDCSRIQRELGWRPAVGFDEGLEQTVDWYLNNPDWVNSVRSGEYRNWVERNYGKRI
jgi:dTDP-glucose 4,6-dehydratase